MIDTAMTLLFPFLDFIPFGLPRYWIHRDKLKIRYRYVVMLLTAVSCVNSAAFYLINQGGYEAAARWTTLMRYSFMLFNLICSFLLIREQFQKLMFTYLVLMSGFSGTFQTDIRISSIIRPGWPFCLSPIPLYSIS